MRRTCNRFEEQIHCVYETQPQERDTNLLKDLDHLESPTTNIERDILNTHMDDAILNLFNTTLEIDLDFIIHRQV